MTFATRSNKRTRSLFSSDPPPVPSSCPQQAAPEAAAVVQQKIDEPQRKRTMVATKLRFLEKMPPLRDYQRGRFGRRGGVDGGDGGNAVWVQALDESMEETSFVTCEAPSRAALVAPVPMPVPHQSYTSYVPTVPVSVAMLGPRSVGIPSTRAPTRVTTGNEDAIRTRQRLALQAVPSASKDDEARPATEGMAL
ncbi:hypothetical protein PsorP6_017170 [Peronosclerospora sorghi]|uniref:Uncharacterized protein n=1 Tax=Peronosclerospora sorghi TaxID=230839 RepID=A0ACC0WFX5_9STRA|nr:hypothetical protein PsorP6_017170 [Peronosclerospora sorghi]